MEHYFNRMQPIVMNEHSMVTLNHIIIQFADEVRGEIEAWSERGSGWVVDEILEAVINVAQYQPLKDVRANCYCASLLRTKIHATSSMSARA